ncbi:MAG TPA: hypothetical protein VIJ79_07720 [Acidobacteriaceae bacterium]
MKRHDRILYTLLLLLTVPACAAQPSAEALTAFNTYAAGIEGRLAQQHRSPNTFLVPANVSHSDDLVIEQLTPPAIPGAILHHWRGTAFVPGATAADFERLMRDFNSYPRHFSPEVLQAKTLTQHDDRLQAFMRVRQHHIITVVMDTTYDVDFAHLDLRHGYSISRSTNISEIDAAETAAEHSLTAAESHGFLWRQNTYWSYEQRDGGLTMQIESVSLSRSIPRGLGWAVRPFVESVPRESLEFTLRSACNALRK